MKALLVNDTFLQGHIGCYATMNGLRKFLSENNVEIIDTIFCKEIKFSFWGKLSPKLKRNKLIKKIEESDIVIINGEGTIHDGNAPEIEFIIKLAIERKTPFAVVNAYVSNYHNMLELLQKAEYVSVRDGDSFDYLKENSVEANRCADAAIFSDLNMQIGNRPDERYFIDWHIKQNDLISPIAEKAFSEGFEFFPFRREDTIFSWNNILSDIGGAKVISGRYHGTVFSCMSGAQQVILPSNTDKMRSFAKDYGLEKRYADNIEDAFEIFETEASGITKDAQEKILSERNSPEMHPLAFLKRQKQKAPLPIAKNTGKTLIFDYDDEYYETNIFPRVRRFADYLAGYDKAEDPVAYAKLIAACEDFSEVEIDLLSNIAKQENIYNAMVVASKLYLQELRYDKAFSLIKILAEDGCEDAIRTLAKLSFSFGKQFQIFQICKKSLSSIKSPSPDILTKIGDIAANLRFHEEAVSFYKKVYKKEQSERLLFKLVRQSALSGNDKQSKKYLDEYIEQYGVDELSRGDTFEIAKIQFIAGEFEEAWKNLSINIFKGKKGDLGKRTVKELSADDLSAFENTKLGIDLTETIGIGSEVKYISLLKDVNVAKLVVKCDRRLKKVLSNSYPEVSFISHSEDFPSNLDNIIDYAELGLLTRGKKEQFKPAEKYLLPDEKLVKKFKGELGEGFNVGISWATNNKNSNGYRNVDINNIVKNFDDSVNLVSLESSLFEVKNQIGSNGLSERVKIIEGLDPIKNMDEYLALIQALDAVVTIDCSVVHFAPALGVKTYMIASNPMIWKWERSNKKSYSDSYWHDRLTIINDLSELKKIKP